MKDDVIATYGKIENFCFDPSLTDFSDVFNGLTTFNVDISGWVSAFCVATVSFHFLFFLLFKLTCQFLLNRTCQMRKILIDCSIERLLLMLTFLPG